MLVMAAGTLVSARLLQPLKAKSPMLEMLDGRLIDTRLVQSEKALLLMLIVPSGTPT